MKCYGILLALVPTCMIYFFAQLSTLNLISSLLLLLHQDVRLFPPSSASEHLSFDGLTRASENMNLVIMQNKCDHLPYLMVFAIAWKRLRILLRWGTTSSRSLFSRTSTVSSSRTTISSGWSWREGGLQM